MSELKPCPFCGNPPNSGPWQKGLDRGWPDSFAVECSSALDDCHMNPSITDFDKESVVSAWNRRAAPVVTVGLAYKLRDALDSLGIEITSDSCMKALTAALEQDDAD